MSITYLPQPTFLLRWNPEISSVSNADWTRMCRRYPYLSTNWSVHDYTAVGKYDQFYMMRVDGAHPGIVMKGRLKSLPYTGKDWAGTDKLRHYCDLAIDFIMDADTQPYITLEQLREAIPELDWLHGHSGVKLPDGVALKLDALFRQWIRDNQGFVAELCGRKSRVIDPDAMGRIKNIELFRQHCDFLKCSITSDHATHDCSNIYCNFDYLNSTISLGLYVMGCNLMHVKCHRIHRVKCDLNSGESYFHDFRVHLHPSDCLHVHANGIEIFCDTLEFVGMEEYTPDGVPVSI